MTAPLVRSHHADAPGSVHNAGAETARRQLREALTALLPTTPACAADPADWYSTARGPGADAVRAACVAACERCPLVAECDAAGEHEAYGIWGGHDRDRQRLGYLDRQVEKAPRCAPPLRTPRAPRSRNWPARPLPVSCPYCHVAAGVVCRTGDGALSEKSHRARKQAARSAAA
jgi:Transcription factor WhiB